ncbi:hypothetical protein HS088_TW19G00854 [Tripterygium wilfordii]|uniref:F-box associated domain-containing protein n=1 Tax=Tripterygium wilfordii TaxID=458696 RepID=A0A7J7CAS3_TRIWF|nr:uncharacterized protein LOC119985706 [Tripterygium wilfordii]KAF5731248.1 hypothetical protein HS088_TW19G00854 [Tripterygium wilfordii]
MARVPRTGKCKLACVGLDYDNGVNVFKFFVHTVGVDKSWRVIEYSLKRECPTLPAVKVGPFSVGKFIFWTETPNLTTMRLIAMVMDNESIHLVRSPLGHHNRSGYISMGNDLSCVRYENSMHYMHILTDVNSGTWVLSHKFAITLPPEFGFPSCICMRFICCLGNSQELILRVEERYFAFSLKTQQLRCIDNYFFGWSSFAVVHTNNLVSW